MGIHRSSTTDMDAADQRLIDFGRPEMYPPFADNSVSSSKYTWYSFFPMAIREQFRKNGNVYFLCVGILMFFGYYTPLFDSAITPWTTLGPLAVVVSVSVAQEGYTDIRRHRSDKITNYRPCVVLRRAEEMNQFYHPEMGRKTTRKRDTRLNQGKDMNIKVASQLSSKSKQVSIAFESLYRKNIYAGDLVLVRKREMIPADLILLASSNEGGSAYVETSSIDGETNLKLRHSPHLPLKKQGTLSDASTSSLLSKGAESLENAIERIANISHLGHPDGISAVVNPANNEELPILERKSSISNLTSKGRMARFRKFILGEATNDDIRRSSIPKIGQRASYIAALTSEPPNTHVNNFSGKLTLPPESIGAQSEQAPLNAENILLRGAVLRNTEWVIGLACFTGADTKLVMNSVATPSKFSQLDRLINRIVFLILFLMLVCVMSLGFLAVDHNNRAFNTLWFTGYSKDVTEPWPYFNLEGSSDIPPPVWRSSIPNYIQMVFMFITMLSNFVPLSLYISVEMVTVMMMLYIGWDIDMYHEETDTPAAARSTIVTDLGLVEYIFSDKTGTLTSNIMEFKRCSVDGHTFGMPMSKSAPQVEQQNGDNVDTELVSDSAHPLKNLLASSASPFCLSSVAESNASDDHSSGLECGIEKLTFNAEMFLRVMSICHTVVVEKDTEESEPDKTTNGSIRKKPWGSRSRSATADSNNSAVSNIDSKKKKKKKSSGQKKKDGAPNGHAYQAESPDEGALVSAASIEYGFQLLGRDSSGVQISCPCPSLFEDKGIVEGVKNGTLTAKELASQTASSDLASSKYLGTPVRTVDEDRVPHAETWSILAINKFDSDRKRMSVLVRSPPELGSLPMLFCKGADSSMLLEGVSEGISAIENMDNKEKLGSDAEGFQISSLLGIQAHLGEFASEGLRTLVLGVKLLSEEETKDWLSKFKDASTSIEGRDEKLTAVAYAVEKNLHIVGATAIEDKLQDGVPETIANLGKAGMKLWVLTGDKRETAIEIGYSTKVLTPKMHLTEVVDGPPEEVKALVAMELMRHIKIGNLPDYQLAALDEPEGYSLKSVLNCFSFLRHTRRIMWLAVRHLYISKIKRLYTSKSDLVDLLQDLEEEKEAEIRNSDPRVERRKVRECARAIIKEFWSNPRHSHLKKNIAKDENDEEPSIVSDEPPAVFERAKSAKASLESRRQIKTAPAGPSVMQKLALAKVSTSDRGIFDEEALSMQSYDVTRVDTNFDKGKRSILERLFATDKDVRHGRLYKHLKDEVKDAIALDTKEQVGKKEIESMVGVPADNVTFDTSEVKRGLILEGAALKHLLGDPELEEMLFAVASCCESVIACRVSPIQKALLLKMVRKYVSPTPTTLAIGDGANDVGMIQEAHIGIGISGLEGQQAVNASDFSIAQFRYLEPLLLIHGRWNFMRMSKSVLFFFYKNAALIGTVMVFSEKCLHSGTLLYDDWVISVFNFVGGSLPIVCMAVFDRDLPRDYVLRNSEVYKSGPRNEFLSFRMTFRWVFITVIHALTVYHFTAPAIQLGGGVTSAFKGLMANEDRDTPGNGEGGDLQVFGTTIYSNLIYVVTLKAIFETRSIIHGEFPSFTCRRGVGEGWPSRIGYTWVFITWGSVLFYLFFLYMYQLMGRDGVSSFFDFIFVSNHLLNMRSITWMVSILAPTIACIWDVTGKVYSNMFYPTQTQIHAEIALREGRKVNKL